MIITEKMADESGEPVDDVQQNLADSCVYVLIELHEFINNIFSRLSMRSLHTCAIVCKKWYYLVKKEKLKRQKPFWMFYDHRKHGISHRLEQPILLQDSKIRIPSRSVAISSRHPRAAKHEKMEFLDYVKRLLPRHCSTIGIVTDGIIGADGLELHEKESGTDAAVLILPKLDNFHVNSFIISMSQMDAAFRDSPLSTREQLLELLRVPAGTTPKVILTFNTDAMFADVGPLEKSILHHFDGKVIVAGGFTDLLFPDEITSDGEAEDTLLTGVVFSGDIQMASTVLDQSIKTKEAAEDAMYKLKCTNTSLDWAVAFMFACIGRGHYHYGAMNVETKAFRKHFPKTPVFGFFGNGEVGHHYLPDYSKSDHTEYSVLEKDNLRHSYTTIMVLVSRLLAKPVL